MVFYKTILTKSLFLKSECSKNSPFFSLCFTKIERELQKRKCKHSLPATKCTNRSMLSEICGPAWHYNGSHYCLVTTVKEAQGNDAPSVENFLHNNKKNNISWRNLCNYEIGLWNKSGNKKKEPYFQLVEISIVSLETWCGKLKISSILL